MIGSTNLDKPQPNVLTTTSTKNLNYTVTTNLNNLSEGNLGSSQKYIDRQLHVKEQSSKYEAVKKAARGRRMSDNFSDIKDLREATKKQRRLSEQDREAYVESKSIENFNVNAVDDSTLTGNKPNSFTVPR